MRLQHAEEEIRLQQEPFPLYPGEELKLKVTLLTVVPALEALRLKVERDFVDEAGVERKAGDEMLFEGPGTFVPRKEVGVIGKHSAIIIKPNTAVKLRQGQYSSAEWKDKSFKKGVFEKKIPGNY